MDGEVVTLLGLHTLVTKELGTARIQLEKHGLG